MNTEQCHAKRKEDTTFFFLQRLTTMEAFNIEDQAAIIARSTQLSEQHRAYLAKHPALTELMHDFLTNVLVNKPDDCYQFCQVSPDDCMNALQELRLM